MRLWGGEDQWECEVVSARYPNIWVVVVLNVARLQLVPKLLLAPKKFSLVYQTLVSWKKRVWDLGMRQADVQVLGSISMYRSRQYIIVTSRTVVVLIPRTSQLPLTRNTKVFVTLNTQKKEGKIHSLALTLTVTLSPNHLAMRHCWQLRYTTVTLPLTHQLALIHDVKNVNTWCKHDRNGTWRITQVLSLCVCVHVYRYVRDFWLFVSL